MAKPLSGVDQIKRFNFIYGDGMSMHTKAVAAYAAKPTRDWQGVRQYAESSLAKDASHLDSHWLLGLALAQAGEHAAAVDHLVTALAGDYLKYGPLLDKKDDDDLKPFLSTPHGTAVAELAAKIRADYLKRISTGLILVGRRSQFRWPDKPGVQDGSSRGELYAFDRETRRYLRLTHTEHKVVGYVRAPSGSEVAVLGFDRIDHPKEEKGKDATDPSLLVRIWVDVYDTATWQRVGQRAVVAPTPAAREVSVGYGAGDQLLVTTAPANGRWGIGELTVSSIDRTTGKLAKVKSTPPLPRIIFSLDDGRVERVPEGVKAAWSGDPATAPALEIGGKSIPIPESGKAAQSTIAVAPDGANVALATYTDPCAKDTLPSLYVATAAKSSFKHLLTAASRFATRWLDATTLAYEDGEGAIRLWSTTEQHETMRLENRAGLALEVLSPAPGPLCKQAPPTTAAGSGEEPPLPPEESGSASPP